MEVFVAHVGNDVVKCKESSQEAKEKCKKNLLRRHLTREWKRLFVSLTIDEVPMHECPLLST
jgi:hypothetical protein